MITFENDLQREQYENNEYMQYNRCVFNENYIVFNENVSVYRGLKCFQRKLDIAGNAIKMRLLIFQLIKHPFQIQVYHFDQNRTIKYQC